MAAMDELLQTLAQQSESMNTTVAVAIEAHRKQNDALEKKIQALQAALLTKASEPDVGTSGFHISMEPRSFTDHLTSDVVKLTVFDCELYYVHRSILKSIPFFEAKLEHWCDEPVKLPREITKPAFDNLLTRMYLGMPLPAGNIALCAQIIYLAKYWLLDMVVMEMIAEVLRSAKKEDVPILAELAKQFEIQELSAAVEKLQKSVLFSAQELVTMAGQALMGDKQAQQLCTASLEGHPEAGRALREQFQCCRFFVCSTEQRNNYNVPKTVYPVRVCDAFKWFWQEVKKAKLLKTDLPFISQVLISKLNQTTGYRMNQHWGHTCDRERDSDTTPTTFATALLASGGFGCYLIDAIQDIVIAAGDGLRAGSLQPVDLKELLTLMPKPLVSVESSVDSKMATLIRSLPLATAVEVFHMMKGRITEVGSSTATALQEISNSA
eukprot:TRINITY_DN64906_c0_g1_i1.p1 TRINITY_DN64906_c0_g1~~TRINITY_DN64906_c0_g1_i1.p1  ORF type:complete len:464 (-),score=67.99 TRINITY_DN64906_c0_g1_i1:548-1861(-)